jgi:hypothetical protein
MANFTILKNNLVAFIAEGFNSDEFKPPLFKEKRERERRESEENNETAG